MALTVRPVFCELKVNQQAVQKGEPGLSLQVQKKVTRISTTVDNGKIVLQPRVCTLRSYGSEDPIVGVMKMMKISSKNGEDHEVSPFYSSLTEYIDSSKKSQDFEIISGRLAMIVFAATVTEEVVSGNSLFGKMDLQGIAEAGGVCIAAVICAALLAWFSSARYKVGQIFTLSCNTFIDDLIDQIVDGLFYDGELSDEI